MEFVQLTQNQNNETSVLIFCLAPISEVIFSKEEYKLQGEDLQMKGTNYSGAAVERKANGQPNCNKLETFEHCTDVLKEPIRKHMSSLYSPNMMENVFSARLNIFTKIVYTVKPLLRAAALNVSRNFVERLLFEGGS